MAFTTRQDIMYCIFELCVSNYDLTYIGHIILINQSPHLWVEGSQ